MVSPVEATRGVYEAFGRGDIASVLALLAPDIRWTEAEGGPYGGTSVGPQAVLENVFMKLGADWDGFSAVPAEFIAEDSTVVVLGEYCAVFKATGKGFRAPFAHVWRFVDGKAAAFRQYTDTWLHRQPME
jgi:ketosteroid isomerase-like protein